MTANKNKKAGTSLDLPLAVCCVIQNKEDPSLMLLVSRKDDPTNFGLPGGKVDPGETAQQATVREVKEETGLDIVLGPVVFADFCPAHAPSPIGQDFYTYAFLAEEYSGTIKTQESGVVKWGTWKDQKTGNFAKYNEGVKKGLENF